MQTWSAAAVGAFLCGAILFVICERPAGAVWDLCTGQSKRKGK
eukprot:gene50762-2841_t